MKTEEIELTRANYDAFWDAIDIEKVCSDYDADKADAADISKAIQAHFEHHVDFACSVQEMVPADDDEDLNAYTVIADCERAADNYVFHQMLKRSTT
jgi:hypothetical protein